MTPREIRRLKYASRGISRLGVTRFGKDQPNAGGSGSNLDPGLTFAVDFNQSTTPSSGPPAPFTFTRATTATITDFEGLIKSCLSGELRIYGARRVENLLSATETLNTWTASSSGTGTNAVVTGGFTDPNGGTTAFRVVANAGASGVSYLRSLNTPGSTKTRSIWVKSNTGATQNILGLQTNIGGITATTSWQRVALAGNAAGAVYFDIGVQTTGMVSGSTDQTCDILVWHPMAEDVTGQANQNPSEYVSRGVLSSPFHGYFVDGVKYFNYENGNTVSSNVVTEAQGAAIAGTMGYLAEGQRTNLCLQSETFGTTWLPAAATISSNQITAPSGTTTADQLVAGGTFGLPRVGQITAGAANTTNTFSVYAKAGTKNWLLLYQQSVTTGTDSVRGWFNLNTGVVGSVSNQGTGSGATISITALNDGWYRCTLVGKPSTGASSVRMVVAMANADGGIDYATDVADNLYIWGAQEEDGVSFASTYIPTTTAAVTRNADVLPAPSAGILNSAAMTIATRWSPIAASMGTVFLFGTYVDASNYTAILHDGTNMIARKRIGGVNHDATKALAYSANTTYRIAARFDGTNGCDIWVDGVKGTNDSTTTASQIGTNFQIGADGNGANQAFGVIPTFKAYRSGLSDAQAAAL